MPTPPCLVPTTTIDLTLPANRLRAALRVSGSGENVVRVEPDGVYVPLNGGVFARRVADQPIGVPTSGAAVEWDDVMANGAASWSSLAPEWIEVSRGGLWQAWWTVAMVGGENATGAPSLLGAALVSEDGVVVASHVSSSDYWTSFGAGGSSNGPWPSAIQYSGALSTKSRPMGVHKWGGAVRLTEARYRLVGQIGCPTAPDGFIAGGGWDAAVALPSFGAGYQSTMLSLSFLCATDG